MLFCRLLIGIVVIWKTDQTFPFQVFVNLKAGLSEEDADILKMVSFYFSKKYGKMLRWRWCVFLSTDKPVSGCPISHQMANPHGLAFFTHYVA